MLELIIDNKTSGEYNLSIAETPSIPVPDRDIEMKPIRGRNGSLTKKYGYKDIEFSIALNIIDTTGIKEKIRFIKAWILNAKRLQLSDDSAYYKIKHSFIPDIDNELNLYGYFKASFVAHPFQFIDKPIATMLVPGQLSYNGTIESEPYIKIYGTGDGSLTINNSVINLKNISEFIEIDSQDQEAFKGSSSKNGDMEGDYPTLNPGVNNISWSGGITKIEIDVREVYL